MIDCSTASFGLKKNLKFHFIPLVTLHLIHNNIMQMVLI